MIETSQLQTFVSVAKARSFSKAAEDLHVTQSAISQSIKNLEAKLGLAVFSRSGKNVVLTPAGEKLFVFGNQYLTSMSDTIHDLSDVKTEMRGKVRIGTLTGIGKSWLAHEIVNYAVDNPDLRMTVRMGSHADLLSDFENHLIDILILPEDDVPMNGEKEFFIDEKCTLVIPKGNKAFNFGKKLTLEKLEELPLVLFEYDDHLFFNWCRTKFKGLPKKLNVRFTVNSHGNMLEAVHHGLGMAVIPNHVLNRSYFKDKIAVLPEYEIPSGKIFIVFHKESENYLRIKNTILRLKSHRDTFKI